jgi:hypothetical protein
MALPHTLPHTALQALKPKDKNYPVTDRDGLYLYRRARIRIDVVALQVLHRRQA